MLLRSKFCLVPQINRVRIGLPHLSRFRCCVVGTPKPWQEIIGAVRSFYFHLNPNQLTLIQRTGVACSDTATGSPKQCVRIA